MSHVPRGDVAARREWKLRLFKGLLGRGWDEEEFRHWYRFLEWLLPLPKAIGWDPLPESWDPAVARLTVRSTLGQHIFLGSYLVILIPLAVGRLVYR